MSPVLILTFEGGVVTLKRGDEVSEQTDQNEAELSVQLFTWLLSTPAQVQSQGFREGGGDDDRMLSFLFKHKGKHEALENFGGTNRRWRPPDLVVLVPGGLQQGGLQQSVDPLSGQQVLGLAQLAQAEQQRLGQHQEGRPVSEPGALLLLHCQSQLLQLRETHTCKTTLSESANERICFKV